MRLLDTREQKSPQYLIVGLRLLPEQIQKLPVYDYVDVEHDRGFGTELKHEDFNLKSTATIEQFEFELAKMAAHHQEHPNIHPHAIWNKKNIWDRDVNFVYIEKYGEVRSQIAVFLSMCQDYGVKGHVVESNTQVIALLKRLRNWVPKEDYIKRSHEEPTFQARVFRQIDGVSSPIAIQLAEQRHLASGNNLFNSPIYYKASKAIREVVGFKKNGKPKRLSYKIEFALENGRLPTKAELDDKIAFRRLEEGED